MEFLHELGTWYNLIFAIPLTLFVFFLTLQIVGLGLDSLLDLGADADADADFDLDADLDADFDVDADMDADFDVDADADADFDLDADGDIDGGDADIDFASTGLVIKALYFMNVGKVPLSVLIAMFFASFGFIGLWVNRTLLAGNPNLPTTDPWMFFVCSLPTAFVGALVFTKLFGGVMARILPTSESYAVKESHLVGQVGEVVSGSMTSDSGRIRLNDPRGNIITVYGRLVQGEEEVPKGARVVLVKYDKNKKRFQVAPLESGGE